MAPYTTGEMAKLCGVSVRTVQYYDTRDILTPSEVSEGGRRLYSEEDLRRLRLICFLRTLDLPLENIRELLNEEEPAAVLDVLLAQQEEIQRSEIEKHQKTLTQLNELRRQMHHMNPVTIDTIGDAAALMPRRRRLYILRAAMLILGCIMDAVEIGTCLYAICSGHWLPFALGIPFVIALGILIAYLYYTRTVYLCPHCHTLFRPTLRDSIWAHHTPNTRKLHCPACHIHGFCVETYGRKLPSDPCQSAQLPRME